MSNWVQLAQDEELRLGYVTQDEADDYNYNYVTNLVSDVAAYEDELGYDYEPIQRKQGNRFLNFFVSLTWGSK